MCHAIIQPFRHIKNWRKLVLIGGDLNKVLKYRTKQKYQSVHKQGGLNFRMVINWGFTVLISQIFCSKLTSLKCHVKDWSTLSKDQTEIVLNQEHKIKHGHQEMLFEKIIPALKYQSFCQISHLFSQISHLPGNYHIKMCHCVKVGESAYTHYLVHFIL